MGKSLFLVKSCLRLKCCLQASSHTAYCMNGNSQYLTSCPDVNKTRGSLEGSSYSSSWCHLCTCSCLSCFLCRHWGDTGGFRTLWTWPGQPVGVWGCRERSVHVERWLQCVRKITHCSRHLPTPPCVRGENSVLAVHHPALLCVEFRQLKVPKGEASHQHFSPVERDPRKWRNKGRRDLCVSRMLSDPSVSGRGIFFATGHPK